jgi:shikimate kinase/3-dehydroquinate synthase
VPEVKRIVLIGFSGTGKTSVAKSLAGLLGWSAVDTDAAIETEWGTTIPAIFRDHGEPAFRESERAALARLLSGENTVIATGGGAVVDEAAWSSDLLGRSGTLVIGLDSEPTTILDRLRAQATAEGEAFERPMLAEGDPLARIAALKTERQVSYDRADITLGVDRVSVKDVAAEIADAAQIGNGATLGVRLDVASASSDIVVGPGLLARIGDAVRERWPKAQRLWIITDANVGAIHAGQVEQALCDAGFVVRTCAVAPGEGSKSLGTAGDLFDWMLHGGVERGDVVVALGGGVVGDLAGFVAATILRGVGLVQVPTSLLAMVDSSVGGKTGINHAAGKNLIGAFLQPALVVVDTTVLGTMPPRELRSGWGEVVKHAIIQRSTPGGQRGDLRTFLGRNVQRLRRLEEPVTAYAVWRNIALKAAVVAADEREAGVRALLNFGHTLGHAIEAADYQLLHGEAVAVGMCAATRLGVLAATCGENEAASIQNLMGLFDLPDSADMDVDRVLGLLRSDKKRVAGRQRYVLPLDGGGVTIRDDVPDEYVAQALASVQLERTAA